MPEGASFEVGELTMLLGKPILDFSIERPNPRRTLRALAGLDASLSNMKRIPAMLKLKASLGDDRTRTEVGTDLPSQVDDQVEDAFTLLTEAQEVIPLIRAILTYPTSAAQTAEFPLVASFRGERIFGNCRSTNAVRMGLARSMFAPSDFRLSCRMVARGDASPRDLELTANGSGWNNYAFHGTLRTNRGPVWTIGSQNMSVAGSGVARGFDVVGEREPLASLSFWQDYESTDAQGVHRYRPRAWWKEQANDTESAMVRSSLALLYAYPFPSVCDASIITSRATPPVLRDP